jgi:hypothetical protein
LNKIQFAPSFMSVKETEKEKAPFPPLHGETVYDQTARTFHVMKLKTSCYRHIYRRKAFEGSNADLMQCYIMTIDLNTHSDLLKPDRVCK